MSKKILITGYTGFVGSNLTKYFTDYYLIGLDRVSANTVNEHYNWQNLGAIREINTIIHLAGKAHDTNNLSRQEDYFNINLGLTQQIFDYFLLSSAKIFIFFSSVKAVADRVTGDILTENDEPNPLSPHGQSKLAAERYIMSKPIPKGRHVYILRPCMIHGSGNKGNLNLLYGFVKRRFPWPLGAFENLRSFTSIDNVLYIISELIEKDIESGIYQVADDEPLSTNELIELISESMNRKAMIWRIPKWIVQAAVKVGDAIGLPLNNERMKKLTDSYVVSNQKLKSAIGVVHLPMSSREGLKHTIESFNNSKIP